MKRNAAWILLCLTFASLFTGCKNTVQKEKTAPTIAIANPWSNWDSLEEAEAAAGFSFGLPEKIADRYEAAEYRTMNRQLIEVIYRDHETEVRVRKAKGEGQDISGDYNTYDTCTEENIDGGTVTTYRNSGSNGVKQLIFCQNDSWSITAPEGFAGDDNHDFVSSILGLS